MRLAASACKQRDWAAAETNYRAAVEVGATASELATANRAFGTFLHDRGRFTEAVESYEAALAHHAKAHGEASLPYATCLNCIGQAWSDYGRYADARRPLERSLELMRASAVRSPLDEVAALNALGILSSREGKTAEAVKHYTAALAVVEAFPDCSTVHRNVATLNLAVALTEQGEYAAAERSLVRCGDYLDELKRAGTADHVVWLHAVARLRLKQDDPKLARRCAEKAVEMSKQVHGDSHPRTAACLEVLADVRLADGDAEEAGRLLKTVAAVRTERLGESNPLLAEAYARQAKVASALKNPTDALVFSTSAHRVLTAAFGTAVPARYKWVVAIHSDLLTAAGRPDEAKRVSASLNAD